VAQKEGEARSGCGCADPFPLAARTLQGY